MDRRGKRFQLKAPGYFSITAIVCGACFISEANPQLRYVSGNPPRLVLREQFTRRRISGHL
jgi:hypothetical protein